MEKCFLCKKNVFYSHIFLDELRRKEIKTAQNTVRIEFVYKILTKTKIATGNVQKWSTIQLSEE